MRSKRVLKDQIISIILGKPFEVLSLKRLELNIAQCTNLLLGKIAHNQRRDKSSGETNKIDNRINGASEIRCQILRIL